MEYMTKKEFAERCGVTTVTVFNWIKSNRNGITKYTSKKGIDASIFDDPSWSSQDKTQEATLQEAQLRQELETVKAEHDEMCEMYEAMMGERDEARDALGAALRERDEARRDADLSHALLEEKDKRIAGLEQEKERIAGELDKERIASQETRQLMHQQQALTAQQLQAIQAPRRPLLAAIFPRWYDKKHQPEDDGSTPSEGDAQL